LDVVKELYMIALDDEDLGSLGNLDSSDVFGNLGNLDSLDVLGNLGNLDSLDVLGSLDSLGLSLEYFEQLINLHGLGLGNPDQVRNRLGLGLSLGLRILDQLRNLHRLGLGNPDQVRNRQGLGLSLRYQQGRFGHLPDG
jgi:hypothetical protein